MGRTRPHIERRKRSGEILTCSKFALYTRVDLRGGVSFIFLTRFLDGNIKLAALFFREVEMDKIKWFCILVLVALISGCVSFQRKTTGQWAPGQSLVQNPSVVIVPLADVVEQGEGPVAATGAEFTSAIRDNLLSHGVKVTVADGTALKDAFDSAATLGYAYVLKGAILQWEDNATEWSGKPDRAGLSLELYNVASRQLVASAAHNMNGSSMALASLSPHRFVPELVDQSLGRIFGWRSKVAQR